MSGPKTGRYKLTQAQREAIRLQIQISMSKSVFDGLRSFVEDFLTSTDKIAQYSGKQTNYQEMAKTIKKNATDMVELALHEVKSSDLDSLRKTLNIMELMQKQLLDQSSIITKERKNVEEQYREQVAIALDKGFSTSFREKTNPIKKTANLDEKAVVKLDEYSHNSHFDDTLNNEIESTLTGYRQLREGAFRKNYIALSIVPLLKRCEQYLQDYDAYNMLFRSLIAKREKLYQDLMEPCEPVSFSVGQLSALTREIDELEERLTQKREQEQISRLIDEAMIEMGYGLIGSRNVFKRNGKHFRNMLYAFDKETAVNVTYASDGQITIELGGMDVIDRIPTKHETDQLVIDMASFCKDFEAFEERLHKKGVILEERISMLPPKPEHAQIINRSDYELMKTDAEIDFVKIPELLHHQGEA